MIKEIIEYIKETAVTFYYKVFSDTHVHECTVNIADTYNFVSFVDNWMISKSFKWNHDDWLDLIKMVDNGPLANGALKYQFMFYDVVIKNKFQADAFGKFLEARRKSFCFSSEDGSAIIESARLKNYINPDRYISDCVYTIYDAETKSVYSIPKYFEYIECNISCTVKERERAKELYLASISKMQDEFSEYHSFLINDEIHPL